VRRRHSSRRRDWFGEAESRDVAGRAREACCFPSWESGSGLDACSLLRWTSGARPYPKGLSGSGSTKPNRACPLVGATAGSELGGDGSLQPSRREGKRIGSAAGAAGFERGSHAMAELEMRGEPGGMMVGLQAGGCREDSCGAARSGRWAPQGGDIAEARRHGLPQDRGRPQEGDSSSTRWARKHEPANIESALKSACPMIGQFWLRSVIASV